jgi:hypothetical protein
LSAFGLVIVSFFVERREKLSSIIRRCETEDCDDKRECVSRYCSLDLTKTVPLMYEAYCDIY